MMSTAFWWAALTALIWGVVPILEKLGLKHAEPTVGLFARSAGVAFGALIFACLWSPWKALAAVPIGSFALLALGGFLASFVGQWAFYHALKVGDISQVTPVSGAYPLVAAILAWTIFREPITITRVVGVLLIVTGALLLKR